MDSSNPNQGTQRAPVTGGDGVTGALRLARYPRDGLERAASLGLDYYSICCGLCHGGHGGLAAIRSVTAAVGQGDGLYLPHTKLGNPVGIRLWQCASGWDGLGRRLDDDSGALPAAARG